MVFMRIYAWRLQMVRRVSLALGIVLGIAAIAAQANVHPKLAGTPAANPVPMCGPDTPNCGLN